MLELVQQFAVLDALVGNWNAIQIRIGSDDRSFQEQLAKIATQLIEASSPDDIDVIIDDLLDLLEDTPAYGYVQELIARSNLGSASIGKTRGGIVADSPAIEVGTQVADRSQQTGRWLGTVIADETEPCLVQVHFATNRKPGTSEREYFGSDHFDSLSYGLAEVTIPVGRHRIGHLEQRRWWERLHRKDDPRRYVVLGNVNTLTEVDFSTNLAEQEDSSRDLLVFLHGYRVTFEEAACRAAQFAFDMQFKGRVVLFSWPSLGTTSGYAADEERALLSAEVFGSFLHGLESGPWNCIHLVAHSMGNRVMLHGLTGNSWPNSKLAQIVFVAADVYVDIFRQKFAKIRQHGRRYTSYVSKSDRALLLSSLLHRADRIGIAQDEPFVMEGMETIDATELNTSLFSLGHSYFADQRSVIADIGILLDNDIGASHRGLYQPPNKQYWDFPR